MKAEVKYMKRFNLGNYEHEEFHISVMVGEEETAMEAFCGLKGTVEAAHAGDPIALEAVSKKDIEEEEMPKEKQAKKTRKKKEVKPEPEEEIEEEIEEEDSEEIEEDFVDDSDSDEEEVEEEPAPKKKAAKKTKVTLYSRTNDLHKKIFGETLKNFFPKWKDTPEGKAKVQAASKQLEGQPFIDNEGEITDEFIGQLRKAMSVTPKKK